MSGAAACLALLQRELRAVARSRSQLYSSILFPLMLLALLGAGVSEGLQPSSSILGTGDYTDFLAPGMIAMTAIFASTFSSASFYRDRDTGMLRALLASPHSARTILLGKALAAVVIGSAQSVAVLVLAVVIPGIDLSWQFGWLGGAATVVAAIVTLNVMLNGLALLIAVRVRTMQGFHLIMNLALFPLFFLSGAFFPLEGAPEWLRIISYVNPLTYPVDLIQYACWASSPEGLIGPAITAPVLGGLALAAIVLGLRRGPAAAQ